KNDYLPKSVKDLEENNVLNKLVEKLDYTPQQNTQTYKEHKEIIETPDIIQNIDQYYKDYIEHRKTFDNISNSSVKSSNASFSYLKYFIDTDTNPDFRFFKEVQKKFQLIPKNFFKYEKYYKLTFKELISLKDKEKYQTLDTKTINAHINNFKKFFQFLKYEELIEQNPLNDLIPLIESTEIIKEEYSSIELNKIFNSTLDKNPIDNQTYINMCKISLYCGLRIEEVLSIKKIDIKENVLNVEIADTSSKKHKRQIPIHKNIISVIEYQIKHNKGEYIFFSGNVGNEVNNVGKRVNRRIRVIVPNTSKSFHSFRKNFSQEIELNTNSEEIIKKYLMGHSMNKNITHTVYNRGKMNIDKLKDCINQISFQF
ncbi:MAG: tyrosine-type recombinase/integrase, partial [Campylobacterota bacterium]|nr:tyrosine-type recombinase/integrase [Campylobacterota bacterium]